MYVYEVPGDRVTPEEWRQVKILFEEAAEMPAPDRLEFLNSACQGDESFRAELDSLLASLEDANHFMETPALQPGPAAIGIGASIGPYQIVQVVGEGGMGTEYQAVRVDELYRKLVAIKVIKNGLHGGSTIKRFETERQILAHLDHSNIAKLLDGGTTPEGQPYFVLDFIAGTPIDEYCDRRRLTVPERLSLFLTVCAAVHYAHQKLVIHRDLKPQNILIAEDCTARLLDFGIAKLLDPEEQLADSRSFLQQAQQIYDKLRLRGAVSAEYAGVPARIVEVVQACDALEKAATIAHR